LEHIHQLVDLQEVAEEVLLEALMAELAQQRLRMV
jgi:hypothetical protein